jgi:hypothetical protein
MKREEIEELRKEFWAENFHKYTTEPNENGFDFKYGAMMVDFAEYVVSKFKQPLFRMNINNKES